MLYRKNTGAEVAIPEQLTSLPRTSISKTLKRIGVVLVLFTSMASAQSVQTIDSEVQLAAILCQHPTEQATSDRLLKENAQFVNVNLWNTLLNCAFSVPHQQSPANSIDIFKLTLRVAERLNQPELVATTYYHLGRMYSVRSDVENAIESYETSRKLFEQMGIDSNLTCVLADLGGLYLVTEDYEKAQRYSEQSLAIASRMRSGSSKQFLEPIEYSQARSLHTLGETDLRHGNHDEALNKLSEALALSEKLSGTSPSYNTLTAAVLASVARLFGETGDYGQAFSSVSKAQELARSSEDQNTIASVMNVLGSLLLEQQDYAAAQTWLNESLAIYQAQGNERQAARVLLNLAEIKQQQGLAEEALQLFQRSLGHADSAKLVDVQIAAGAGLGVILTARHDFPNALQTITQSLELARRVNAKTREVELLWRAAQTHYAMQNYHASASLAEEALTKARSLRLPKFTYLATVALGEAYAADEKVELAISTLKDSINQIEGMRDQVVGRQEVRQLFFENKVRPYHLLVELLTKQGRNFEALLYAERAKGRVLLEAVRTNRTDLQNIYTEGEKAEADFLINKLHTINQQIQTQPGEAKPKDELQNELNGVRHELVLFQERLAAAHPELLLRVGPAKSLREESLNRLVRANEFAYLEYVVTEDKVGVFILKRNGLTAEQDLKYVNLPVTAAELRQKVNEFHSALAERQPDFAPLGRELYRLLIAPVTNELQDISTVCIIPDEFLWTLPFQALTTTRGKYLIQEKSLFYAPSLSVLNEMILRRQQPGSKDSLIAFGNPLIEKDDKLNQGLHPLTEAEAEVTAVATTVRTRMKKVLIGAVAEERAFKTLAPQYATIHIASHGVLDNRNPLNSYLVLTKTDGELQNDGLLRAREIIDLHLDADLAVLSACETGNGRISPGEGVVGMSWAFLVAGARSVVVSQWRVNSASTSQLMKNFYVALARQKDLKGLNKSEALREASLSLLKDRRYRHPFYWAAFVLVSSN